MPADRSSSEVAAYPRGGLGTARGGDIAFDGAAHGLVVAAPDQIPSVHNALALDVDLAALLQQERAVEPLVDVRIMDIAIVAIYLLGLQLFATGGRRHRIGRSRHIHR
jgi:hypothetical protein